MKHAWMLLAGCVILAGSPLPAAAQGARPSVVDSTNAHMRGKAKRKAVAPKVDVTAAKGAKAKRVAPDIQVAPPLAGAGEAKAPRTPAPPARGERGKKGP